MSEEPESTKGSGRSRFLSKSKWGKVFKENDSPPQPGKVGSFKLNEDVVDFLKPSTDRVASTRPKINIAVAQRFQDAAHGVRRENEAQRTASTPVNGWRKPRRREGLVVGFVKTTPVVIGEGGDEAADPPREISRLKSMVSRSVSGREPGTIGDGMAMSNAQYGQAYTTRQAQAPMADFVAPPMRRVQTSHNEFSPPVHKRVASPPVEQVLPHRPSLGRTPTGFQLEESDHEPEQEEVPASTRQPPRPAVKTSFEENDLSLHDSANSNPAQPSGGGRGFLSPAPSDAPISPGLRRQRDMTSNEGMALRRASALYMNEEQASPEDFGEGVQPPTDFYNILSQPLAAAQISEPLVSADLSFPPESARSPYGSSPFVDPKYTRPGSREPARVLDSQRKASSDESPLSPDSLPSPGEPSPFADPKFMKRRSGDAPPAPRPDQQNAFQSSRQQRNQDNQPSYTRDARSQSSETDASSSQENPAEATQATDQPGFMKTPDALERRIEQQSSYMRASQPSENPVARPSRSPPALSPSRLDTNVMQDTSRERSPLRDRIFASQPVEDASKTIVSPFEQSAGVNHFKRSPIADHRRDASRDVSPQTRQPARSSPFEQPPSNNPFTRSAGNGHQRGGSRDLDLPHVGELTGSSPPERAAESDLFTRSPGPYHIRGSSRDLESPQIREPIQITPQRPTSRQRTYSESPQSTGLLSSSLGKGAGNMMVPSPMSRGPSPADYFSAPKAYQGQPAKSPVANLRIEEIGWPSSAASTRSGHGGSFSPLPTSQEDSTADLALADFAGRVAHMKGVFRLTAEKEQPGDRCSPEGWLRTALWWYLRGKAGLEATVQQRSKYREAPRELLMQPHVDLAKAWWVITDPLEQYDMTETGSPPGAKIGSSPEQMLQQSVTLLRGYMRSLCVSMQKNQLMPPQQSLIQGQDTTIWIDYPRFTADAAAALGGGSGKSLIVESSAPNKSPLEAMPLGDTRDHFCYGRFQIEVSMTTDEADTDRVVLPCTLSMLRGRRDYQVTLVVASQNDLINLQVGPKQSSAKGLTWSDVSWKASSQCMVVHLPRSFDLTIRMQDRDFRLLWSLVEYSRKVEHSLRADAGEKLVHESRLAEVQYSDSSNASTFPSDKVKGCGALLFERTAEIKDGGGARKLHRGYRLLLVTDPSHKSLSMASHELCKDSPLLFEFLTDSAANGTTAMVIRVRERTRQCRILMVFPNMTSRQALFDVMNGLTVGPDETIVGKMAVSTINIEPASQVEGFTPLSHPALQSLRWSKLGVTNHQSSDSAAQIPDTVESESLRIVAWHAAGCITDRLNLGKGELMLRLPCADAARPCMQMLRQPQEDLTMSIDSRQAPQHIADGTAELLRLAQEQPTIRTFAFATLADLHAFQAAITGFTVRYDGVASTFGIARRMMVVPIPHKWQASSVRIQVVTQSNITQVMAFMEEFRYADALCFQVKTTDTFETVKGDAKGKKWAIKMKDAKFTLPSKEKEVVDLEARVRRRFVNLEGLEYAEEHDDITIGFESERERDDFAQTLPAVATVGRGLTLKRRI